MLPVPRCEQAQEPGSWFSLRDFSLLIFYAALAASSKGLEEEFPVGCSWRWASGKEVAPAGGHLSARAEFLLALVLNRTRVLRFWDVETSAFQ